MIYPISVMDMAEVFVRPPPDSSCRISSVDKLNGYPKAICHLNFDPKKLAFDVGPTAPYLSKLFKLYRGMPLIEYLSYLKIEKAKQLIRSDPEQLTKEIGDLRGSSPSEFRKRLEVRP
jgi:AraC-like DNA-binding protein